MSKIVQKDFPLRGSTTEQGFSGDRTSIYYFYKLNSPFLNQPSLLNASNTDRSSKVEVSPEISAPLARVRNNRRMILSERVLGNASAKRISPGRAITQRKPSRLNAH
jgi:hypothetical protein